MSYVIGRPTLGITVYDSSNRFKEYLLNPDGTIAVFDSPEHAMDYLMQRMSYDEMCRQSLFIEDISCDDRQIAFTNL